MAALFGAQNTKQLQVYLAPNKALTLEHQDNALICLRCTRRSVGLAWTRYSDTQSHTHSNAIMSVLKLNTCHVGDWECTTCAGDYNTTDDQPWQTKNADMVCTVCIARVFELALENDYTWPPRFGPDVLHTQDFASILPAELLDRITKRLAKGEPRIDPEEVAASVKGQVRGKDFQICPGCCNVINLKEACNHILCVCFVQFCYLCGQVATHDGDHFKEGGCPRWGQPKSEQAMFDQPDPMAEMRAAHNNRILQDFAQHRLEFHADIWTWNVAIQTTTDTDLSFVMGNLLRGNPKQPGWSPTRGEYAQVLNAMRAQNPLHRVSDEQWDLIVTDSADQIKRLAAKGPKHAQRHLTPHPTVVRGLLRQPVGGLFNMATQSGRVAAFMWMHDSVRAYPPNSRYRSIKNVAVFDVGPTDEPRLVGATLMAYLFLFGDSHTMNRFSFKRMAGHALLVELHQPLAVRDRPDALYSEAFWRQELLTKLWHRMAYPDQQPVAGDAEWTRLWSEASRAWHEQTGISVHAAL